MDKEHILDLASLRRDGLKAFHSLILHPLGPLSAWGWQQAEPFEYSVPNPSLLTLQLLEI